MATKLGPSFPPFKQTANFLTARPFPSQSTSSTSRFGALHTYDVKPDHMSECTKDLRPDLSRYSDKHSTDVSPACEQTDKGLPGWEAHACRGEVVLVTG